MKQIIDMEENHSMESESTEMEQKNDPPESGNDGADSAGSADEMPDSDNNFGDSANDGAEQPPCDWKNASGDDDGKEDSTLDDEQEPLPEGPDLSLRLPAFSPVFDSADDSLRDMARTLKTKYIESGELAVKIVLNNYNGILRPDPKKCMVTCNLKPAKVSTSIHFPADLEITVGQDGRVIVPEDRNHQMEFNEIQPENETPSGTATVDGKTGIVEGYQEDKQESGGPPDGLEPGAESYPCGNIDCPFYWVPDIGKAGCGYDLAGDPENSSGVADAVQFQNCTRPEVLQAYADAHPAEDDTQKFESEDEES